MSAKKATPPKPDDLVAEPTNAVEQAILEIKAKLAELAPQHEGLRDYARLNLKPETLEQVNLSIAQYDARVGLLMAALAALEALAADGHPELPAREVEQLVLDDLLENAATIEAALGKFELAKASTLGLDDDAPEEK